MNEKVNTDNIYELWYLWLKTTDPKTWTRLMRETLRDCDEPFEEWWERCKEYFMPEFDSNPVWEIKDKDDFERHHDITHLEGELIIALNVYAPASSILKSVKKLLNERKIAYPIGRPKFDDWLAELYELYRRPDLPTTRALCTMLNVYQEWKEEHEKKERGEKPDPMWKIGLRLGLLEGSQSYELERTMTATVSRYLKWSKELRKNIIKGSLHFPKYK